MARQQTRQTERKKKRASKSTGLEPLMVDVLEVSRLTSLSRTVLYGLQKPPPNLKIGRKRLYPLDKLRKWVADRAETARSGGPM